MMRRPHTAIALIILSAVLLVAAGRDAACHPFDQTYQGAVDALPAYKALVEENPEDIELRYLYADMLIMADDLDESERQFKLVLKYDPEYDMAYYKLSEVYYRKQKYEESLEPLKKIKAEDMQDDRLIAEATIYLKLKKPKTALKKARAGVKEDKLNPTGPLVMALAYVELDKPKTAIKYIEQSFGMDPFQPMVYDWLKQILADHLSLKQQLSHFKKLKKKVPKDSALATRMAQDIKSLERRVKDEKKK